MMEEEKEKDDKGKDYSNIAESTEDEEKFRTQRT